MLNDVSGKRYRDGLPPTTPAAAPAPQSLKHGEAEGAMLDLSVFLPYLLNRAGSRIAAAFSEELRRFAIDLRTWRVLAALHHENGQRISRLAAMTSIETSTLSRLVGRMERRGFVGRRRFHPDQRTVTVHLRDEGRRLTDRIVPLALEYERIALDGFPPEEQASLKRMLKRLFDNMDRLDEATSRAAMDPPTEPAGAANLTLDKSDSGRIG